MQTKKQPKQLSVTVSMCISKTVDIWVDDYDVKITGIDEDNFPVEVMDSSTCNLTRTVEEQVLLPNKAYLQLDVYDSLSADNYDALKDWHVDDLIVVPNE